MFVTGSISEPEAYTTSFDCPRCLGPSELGLTIIYQSNPAAHYGYHGASGRYRNDGGCTEYLKLDYNDASRSWASDLVRMLREVWPHIFEHSLSVSSLLGYSSSREYEPTLL